MDTPTAPAIAVDSAISPSRAPSGLESRSRRLSILTAVCSVVSCVLSSFRPAPPPGDRASRCYGRADRTARETPDYLFEFVFRFSRTVQFAPVFAAPRAGRGRASQSDLCIDIELVGAL